MVLALWRKASTRRPFGLLVPDVHWLYPTTPTHHLLSRDIDADRSGVVSLDSRRKAAFAGPCR